ncbi:hypothetical protein K435DRAFT_868425 [Dendrothele bispora CBS 962.96]|uniref:Uncharacterized protein n=1 Tax=Dendrothele bispora (strain CBS 962.96) TaxID=1314807 RepID=A0A4S8LC87_DENBC|nr:hypothetical protein K435DRAFT_868425 [Dendrothele bispora CBS 962.96]
MSSASSAADNTIQTMPSILPSITLISTTSITPLQAVTIAYNTTLSSSPSTSSSSASIFPHSGRAGASRQQQIIAARFNYYDIYRAAYYQVSRTSPHDTHVNCENLIPPRTLPCSQISLSLSLPRRINLSRIHDDNISGCPRISDFSEHEYFYGSVQVWVYSGIAAPDCVWVWSEERGSGMVD